MNIINKSQEFFSHLFILGIVMSSSISSASVVVLPMLPLLIFLNNPFPISKKNLYIFIGFIFCIILMLALNLSAETIDDFKLYNQYIRKMIFVLIVFSVFFTFYQNRKELLMKSINIVLIIMLLAFYLQFSVYYSTGYFIDYLEPITGIPQRYESTYASSAGFIRPGGLMKEPGNYGMVVLLLLALSYLDKRLFTKIHFFTILSFIATTSLFSIISAVLVTIVVIIDNYNLKLTKKNIIITFMVLIGIYYGVLLLEQYLAIRSSGTNGGVVSGTAQRSDILNYWLSLSTSDILSGQGFVQTKFKDYVISDSGLLFKVLYEYGLFSIPLIIILIIISWGFPLFFLFMIFLTKLTYLYFVFWLYFVSLVILKEKV